MQITLLTYGSRGDVEPFVSLGRGLFRAGHTVRLVAPGVFASLVSTHGIDFVPLPGDPYRLVRDLVDEAGGSWPRMARAMSRFVLPLAAEVMARVQEACQGAEVILHSFLLTSAGYETAKRIGAVDLSAQFFPVFASTFAFPGPVFPDLPLGPAYRRLTHKIIEGIFWQGSRFLYGRVRRANPHLPPLTDWPFAPRDGQRTPILYAFSPHVIPPPADWHSDVHVTGYWFLENDEQWQPPQSLLDFFEAGSAPIAIGFGSTVTRRPDQIVAVVAEALARSGQRAVIAGPGWPSTGLPASVLRLDDVPYGWLFPRVSAVVHHGGAGTTAAALRAGVPSIVVPFASDQPFWGRRVHRLGVGPSPIPSRRLSVERLTQALIKATSDEGMRRRADELGCRIRSESGVSRAIDVILQYATVGHGIRK